jgi:hypothetical protein
MFEGLQLSVSKHYIGGRIKISERKDGQQVITLGTKFLSIYLQ